MAGTGRGGGAGEPRRAKHRCRAKCPHCLQALIIFLDGPFLDLFTFLLNNLGPPADLDKFSRFLGPVPQSRTMALGRPTAAPTLQMRGARRKRTPKEPSTTLPQPRTPLPGGNKICCFRSHGTACRGSRRAPTLTTLCLDLDHRCRRRPTILALKATTSERIFLSTRRQPSRHTRGPSPGPQR